MNFKNISSLLVYYLKYPEKLLVGKLALKERTIFFEYDTEFLKTGIELSPFKLPLKPGITTCQDRLFEGLFGLFNDSLPDGWGRLLLDRMLTNQGIPPSQLTSLDRLRYVGTHGMGALAYEPEITGTIPSYTENLDEIAKETLEFQENDDDQFVEKLLAMNGSSAGAHPKILVNVENIPWLIKFRSSLAPKDIGPIEYAYHLMAKAAQLDVTEAKLFPSEHELGYFGSKRFDRANGKYLHMHTMSGLFHIDHRIPSLDYETILKGTLWLTKNIQECEKQLRAAIFNVLSHNRDDHAKNFSFLMDENGTWKVSPAYDLTFSSGPAGEHCTTVMGEGKQPILSHFLKLGEICGIPKEKTLHIIDEVKNAVSHWNLFASEAEVSSRSRINIQTALNRVLKDF